MSLRFPNSRIFRTVCPLLPLVLCVSIQDAQAYKYAGDCWDSPAEYDRSPFNETRNACSIPSGPERDAYFSAIRMWNEASRLGVVARFQNDTCIIEHGDGSNEIALVPRDSIEGNNGFTQYFHVNFCTEPYGAGDYSESDTLIADDVNFNPPSPLSPLTTSSPNVWGIIAHEIGHQLGLAHASNFNILSTNPRPTTPVGPAPFPDDIRGVKGLYGTKSITDLFPTAQRWDAGTSGAVRNMEPQTVCRSANALLTVTTVNPGNTAPTHWQNIRISPDPSDGWAAGSRVILSYSASISAHSYTTQSFAVQGASIGLGRHYVYHVVDPDLALSEAREHDNSVRQYGFLRVIDC